jgi:hypothetical protein
MTNIIAKGQIDIHSGSKAAFAYFSNLQNDKYWRKEINSTTMTSKPQIGALAIEDSFLSKRTPSNILELKCVELIQDQKIVYETLPGSQFYLKSVRQVTAINESECRVTYNIEFDKNIVKHGLGFGLPGVIIDLVANRDLKKYLKKLKTLIETKNRIKTPASST